jgi:hypothetical protein
VIARHQAGPRDAFDGLQVWPFCWPGVHDGPGRFGADEPVRFPSEGVPKRYPTELFQVADSMASRRAIWSVPQTEVCGTTTGPKATVCLS